jgi:hypothetical protein
MTRHLDDEALSAALDGAAAGAEEAHLSSCPQCQARLASLAAVARAVGTAVTPRPSADIDAAVAQALMEWTPAAAPGDHEGRDQETPIPLAVPHAPVVPIARRGGGSRKWLVAAGGIAAALLVVVGIGALARGTSRTTAGSATAAGPTITTPPSTVAGPSSGTVLGGDLGDQSDPAALAQLVVGALSPTSATATHASVNGSVAGTASGPASPSIAAPAAAAPSCTAQARTALGLAAAGVRYQATVDWQGVTPAVVVVFSAPGGLEGAVMKAADCSLLAILPL